MTSYEANILIIKMRTSNFYLAQLYSIVVLSAAVNESAFFFTRTESL